jgi:glutaryl-CoA dehydrogenase
MPPRTALPTPTLELDPDVPHIADFYCYADLLTDEENARLRWLRAFLSSEVAPVVERA